MQPFSKKMSQILIIGHTNITFAQTALITSSFLAIGPLHVTMLIFLASKGRNSGPYVGYTSNLAHKGSSGHTSLSYRIIVNLAQTEDRRLITHVISNRTFNIAYLVWVQKVKG